jgi:hydroxyacylglutathione hydrolase
VRHHRPVTVLDVRRDSEWSASHIDGAVHIALHDLPGRIGELPGGELWVHCEAGYRASVAASFLDAAGRTVVAIDDDYDRAVGAGLPVVTPVRTSSAAR